MLQYEVDIASTLQCRLAFPTCTDFEPFVAQTLVHTIEADICAIVVLFAQMLGDVMLLDYHVGNSQWKPSIVRFTSFIVATNTLDCKMPSTVLQSSDLDPIVRCMAAMYQTFEKHKTCHTRKKPKYKFFKDTSLPNIDKCIIKMRNDLQINLNK